MLGTTWESTTPTGNPCVSWRKEGESATYTDPRSSDEPDWHSVGGATFASPYYFVLQGARSADDRRVERPSEHVLVAVSGCSRRPGPSGHRKQLGGRVLRIRPILLQTLAFVGLVTFGRVLQSGIEDTEYARRIARLRGYYLEHAPEIAPYLLRDPPAERLLMQRVPGLYCWQ